ncbi:AzlC family ABC transporter permease [Paenibacillus sp. SC116]|uniref:AzlC family ABC transporter permease n=1 Tax=Paenibacillus sp. SC116 TaxID=2968986 RepID=UPI00215A2567|nr:AzlC family ABC transporter permease [Paenibacillus sp. SC116]MCR8842668.1 AzlC family ABC transporter permease [Paenibacillus sp. SC116]
MNVQLNSIYKDEVRPSFLEGVKDCVPTLIGYISIAIAMGIVGVSSNLTVLEVGLLAVFVYAGSAQFIICALLAAGSPISVIIFTTFIVNIRHFLLSMTLAPQFNSYSLLKNIGIGALLTDESFGVAVNKLARKEAITDKWMNGLNVTAYSVWVVSCVAGALLGKWIPNPEAYGLDFSLSAMFVALLVSLFQTIEHKKVRLYLFLIIIVTALMIGLSMFMPTYIAIIIATVIGATIGVLKDK